MAKFVAVNPRTWMRKQKVSKIIPMNNPLSVTVGGKNTTLVDADYVGRQMDRAARRREKAQKIAEVPENGQNNPNPSNV